MGQLAHRPAVGVDDEKIAVRIRTAPERDAAAVRRVARIEIDVGRIVRVSEPLGLAAADRNLEDREIARTGSLGGWAPGVTPHHLPDGVARLLPKGSDLIIQTHFHPSGKDEEEASTVGLYFAKQKPEKVVATIPMAGRPLSIPAGEKRYVVEKDFTVPLTAEILGITPHAHLLCKSIKVTATAPIDVLLPPID